MPSYYVGIDGKQSGPFEEVELLRRIDVGLVRANDLCWREGMADWQPIGTVLSVAAWKPAPPPIPVGPMPAGPIHAAVQAPPLFLHIPVARLILMSITTFSLYEVYWLYRNWRYVKERDNLTIQPFWRGVFGIFFCHSLLRRIHEDEEARAVQQPSFSPGGLATGWVVLVIISNLLSRAPGIPATIVAAFVPSLLCLVPVQNYINAVARQRSPGQPYYRWSSGHIVLLVIGIVIWALLLIGLGAEP